MQGDFDAFMASLHGDLAPIQELASRLRSGDCDETPDAFALSHRPHIAPFAYALRLYKPLSPVTIATYQQLHGLEIVPQYLSVLQKLNGIDAFQFSLFGVPPSMANNPPLLNRSVAQPYDIATANRSWRLEYPVPVNWFHIGGGPYSFDENIGYFIDQDGTIQASRKNGELLRSWSSFRKFLADELALAEAGYPAYEAFMAEVIQRTQAKNT